MTTPLDVAQQTMKNRQMQAVLASRLPCGVTAKTCNEPGVARVHDAEEKGYSSVYSCEKHIRYAVTNLHKEGYEAGVTRFYTAGEKVDESEGSIRLKRAERTLEMLIEELLAVEKPKSPDVDPRGDAEHLLAQHLLELVDKADIDELAKIRGRYREAHRMAVHAMEKQLDLEVRSEPQVTGELNSKQSYDQGRSDLAKELKAHVNHWRNPA